MANTLACLCSRQWQTFEHSFDCQCVFSALDELCVYIMLDVAGNILQVQCARMNVETRM